MPQSYKHGIIALTALVGAIWYPPLMCATIAFTLTETLRFLVYFRALTMPRPVYDETLKSANSDAFAFGERKLAYNQSTPFVYWIRLYNKTRGGYVYKVGLTEANDGRHPFARMTEHYAKTKHGNFLILALWALGAAQSARLHEKELLAVLAAVGVKVKDGCFLEQFEISEAAFSAARTFLSSPARPGAIYFQDGYNVRARPGTWQHVETYSGLWLAP